MYSLESPHRSDSNEYTQHTICFFIEDRNDIPKLFPLASRPAVMITPVWLDLLMSRTNLHGPKFTCMFVPLTFDCMEQTFCSFYTGPVFRFVFVLLTTLFTA